MSDATAISRRDALERVISSRLLACDEHELRVLDDRLTAIELRRGAERCIADLHWVDDAGVCRLCERDRQAAARHDEPEATPHDL